MDMNTETTATKPAGFPKKDAPQAFREMAEKSTTQAKETSEKMNAATTEAIDLIKNSYSTAVKGVQDYKKSSSNSLTRTPTPPFVELWAEHVGKQVEMLTEQTKQLAALAQKVTLATAEPLKMGVAEAFNPELS